MNNVRVFLIVFFVYEGKLLEVFFVRVIIGIKDLIVLSWFIYFVFFRRIWDKVWWEKFVIWKRKILFIGFMKEV